jgi:hypothetical protein
MYYRGVKLSEKRAVPVEKIENSGKYNPRDLAQVKQGLDFLFNSKNTIRRDDIVSKFEMQKSEANSYTKKWIENGLLVQQGKGTSTYYTRSSAIASQPVNRNMTKENGMQSDLISRILIAFEGFIRSLAGILNRDSHYRTIRR